MRCSARGLLGSALLALTVASVPACKKRGEATASDLSDAGYQLTTDDWFRASVGNDLEAMKKFVSSGFAADTRNAEGDTALHAAAAAGSQNAANYLLNRGISIDIRGRDEQTPLIAAVVANQTAMVRWLLQQGADPQIKDGKGFLPLMVAVREGSAGSVAELAPYSRGSLDPALLLAALEGKTEVIDSLTNYGASVYARMEDGRTPLMLAAENGHEESVKLLMDIGSSRFTTDAEGKTAADLATDAGHAEIAQIIARAPKPEELTLETPEQLGSEMEAFVDAAGAEISEEPAAEISSEPSVSAREISAADRVPSRSIEGVTLSVSPPVSENPENPTQETVTPTNTPPLIMRHYRESEVPVTVKSVEGKVATVRIAGSPAREVKVAEGQTIPGSSLVVIKVQRRIEDSKLTANVPTEVSVVEVRDSQTGSSREWISGVPSSAHDPIALLEDAVTGQRYTATPGQRFTASDGSEFIVSDVRPNQIVLENVADGSVQTIPLRGPRG
jgi:hypothetical protein